MASSPFRIDEVIGSLIDDMARDELFAFITRHEHPKTDEDLEILAYACLQAYVMFGSEKHRAKARNLISKRAHLAPPDRDEAETQRDLEILDFIDKSTVKVKKDIGQEGSDRAESLFALYNARGGGGPGKQENNAILGQAIIDATTSVAFTLPEHPDRAARLGLLGNLHGIHYTADKQGHRQHLDLAILYLQMACQAAILSTASQPNKEAAWMWHVNLSNMLGEKFKVTQDSNDLDEAISVAEQGRKLAPINMDTLPCDNMLTSLLLIRYGNKNNLEDLDHYIEVAESAVVKCKRQQKSFYGTWLVSLAAALARRFEHAQSRMDIDRAVEMAQLSLEPSTCALGAGHKAEGTSILGYSLMLRSTRSGRKVDLDESVQYADEAVKLTLPGDPYLRQRMARLGICYMRRFEVMRNGTDIQLAIETIEGALNQGTPGGSEQGTMLDNLSLCYSHRAATDLSTNPEEDRNHAVRLAEEVLKVLPKEHAQRTAATLALGFRYQERYQELPEKYGDDAKKARDIFVAGWNRHGGPIDLRISSAQHAGELFAAERRWDEAHEILREAVEELAKEPSRAWRPNDRQHSLARSTGLASMAAAVALQAGFDGLHALRLLELGRQVIARSLASLRPDLSELRKQHPDLADKFVQLRRRIEIPGIFKNASFENLSTENTSELFIKEANEAQAALGELVATIRTLDGFQNFLLPPDATELEHAGDKEPVIVINVSRVRSDAFIIRDGRKIEVLSLLKLDVDELEVRVRFEAPSHGGDARNSPTSPTLEWLWDVIASPILDTLGFTKSSIDSSLTPEQLPRVWWIPTGLLTRLPIHAAGYHHQNNGRDTVLHRVISSYSTSITSLLTARKTPLITPKPPHALLISMPHTPNQRPLPKATSEIQTVQQILHSMGFNIKTLSSSALISAQEYSPTQARKAAVLKKWQTTSIFHFAGHGAADPYNPSQSRLLLQDWQSDPLTVDDLRDGWNLDYSKILNWDDEFLTTGATATNTEPDSEAQAAPFLAYLSACSSGAAEVDVLSDEAVHLAGSFQLAGFRHVVASLWDVKDVLCARVARVLYEVLARLYVGNGLLTDDAVALGLHLSVLELWGDEHGASASEDHKASGGDTIVQAGAREDIADTSGDERDAVLVEDDSAVVQRKIGQVREYVWAPFVHFGV